MAMAMALATPCWAPPRSSSSGTHLCGCRAQSSSSQQASSSSSSSRLARDDLLGLIATEERGVKTDKRSQIVKAIDALAVASRDQTTTDHRLSGTWRMLWTTEKEQLFIVEKAPIFGTQAGDILQVIDVQEGTLNNVITFPPTGSFVVDSTMEVVSSQRVNFRFTKAALLVNGRRFGIPPYGQGWFESVYLDDNIRVAKDIRGDYLVVDRAPYDWTPTTLPGS